VYKKSEVQAKYGSNFKNASNKLMTCVPVQTPAPAGKGKTYMCKSNNGAVMAGTIVSGLTDKSALNNLCGPKPKGYGYCTALEGCTAQEVKSPAVKATVTSCSKDGRLLYKTSGQPICSAKTPGIEYAPGWQLAGYANKTACYDKKDGKPLGYLGNGSYPLATKLWQADTRFGALYGDSGPEQLLMCPTTMDTGTKCPKDKPYWSKNAQDKSGRPAPQCVPCPVTQQTGWGWNCPAANAGNKSTSVSTALTTTVAAVAAAIDACTALKYLINTDRGWAAAGFYINDQMLSIMSKMYTSKQDAENLIQSLNTTLGANAKFLKIEILQYNTVPVGYTVDIRSSDLKTPFFKDDGTYTLAADCTPGVFRQKKTLFPAVTNISTSTVAAVAAAIDANQPVVVDVCDTFLYNKDPFVVGKDKYCCVKWQKNQVKNCASKCFNMADKFNKSKMKTRQEIKACNL
jgi:hypothetical protein